MGPLEACHYLYLPHWFVQQAQCWWLFYLWAMYCPKAVNTTRVSAECAAHRCHGTIGRGPRPQHTLHRVANCMQPCSDICRSQCQRVAHPCGSHAPPHPAPAADVMELHHQEGMWREGEGGKFRCTFQGWARAAAVRPLLAGAEEGSSSPWLLLRPAPPRASAACMRAATFSLEACRHTRQALTPVTYSAAAAVGTAGTCYFYKFRRHTRSTYSIHARRLP